MTAFTLTVIAAAGPTPVFSGARGDCVGVIDGDTIVVELDGEMVEIDLWGVDAPELGQKWGPEARDALATKVLGAVVDLGATPAGAHPTTTVAVGGTDLSRAMVEEGFAWLPIDGETSDAYAAALFVARSSKKGMWSDDRSALEHPEEWLARRSATPIPTPTPIPRALSDIAHSVAIDTTGEGVTISDRDLRSMDISLPDSEYARCILPVLADVRHAVAEIRLTTEGMTRLPVGDVADRLHSARMVIKKARPRLSCPTDEQTHRGQWLVREAIDAYSTAIQVMLTDLRTANSYLRQGDEKLIEARATFNEADAEKQRRAAEANEGKRRW